MIQSPEVVCPTAREPNAFLSAVVAWHDRGNDDSSSNIRSAIVDQLMPVNSGSGSRDPAICASRMSCPDPIESTTEFLSAVRDGNIDERAKDLRVAMLLWSCVAAIDAQQIGAAGDRQAERDTRQVLWSYDGHLWRAIWWVHPCCVWAL